MPQAVLGRAVAPVGLCATGGLGGEKTISIGKITR